MINLYKSGTTSASTMHLLNSSMKFITYNLHREISSIHLKLMHFESLYLILNYTHTH